MDDQRFDGDGKTTRSPEFLALFEEVKRVVLNMNATVIVTQAPPCRQATWTQHTIDCRSTIG